MPSRKVVIRERQVPRVHYQATGFVWVRDFDLGMVTTLGGQIIPGVKGKRYRITLPQLPLEERDIPCYMVNPEQPLTDFVIPRFVVRRESFDPELSRWMPITEEYRVPSELGSPVTVNDPRGPTSIGPSQATIDGHTHYESKEQAWPFDFSYTIEFWARYENFVQPMMFHVMRAFPPYGSMTLVDSLGDERTYNTFAEGGPASLSEVAGMTDNTKAYSLSVRVTGEIDLSDPVVKAAALSFNVALQMKRPSEEL